MNLFDADFTLYEIEQTLEEKFKAEEKTVRTIGDLDLSFEDYKYLVFKLKGLTKYITRIEVFEQYKISIVTALVFAVRYEEDTKAMYKELRKFLRQFQQHHVRYCIRICMNAFCELGLSMYGSKFNSVEDVFEVVSIHANLPKETADVIFQILEDYYSQGENYLLEDELYDKLNKTIQKTYPFLKKKAGNYAYSELLKDLYAACYNDHYSLKQLITEFNQVSISLLESCYMWYMKYSKNSNRLVQIR